MNLFPLFSLLLILPFCCLSPTFTSTTPQVFSVQLSCQIIYCKLWYKSHSLKNYRCYDKPNEKNAVQRENSELSFVILAQLCFLQGSEAAGVSNEAGLKYSLPFLSTWMLWRDSAFCCQAKLTRVVFIFSVPCGKYVEYSKFVFPCLYSHLVYVFPQENKNR